MSLNTSDSWNFSGIFLSSATAQVQLKANYKKSFLGVIANRREALYSDYNNGSHRSWRHLFEFNSEICIFPLKESDQVNMSFINRHFITR